MAEITNLIPSWTINGICSERRELRTKKDNTVWAYLIKIVAMGGTFELTTRDEKLYATFYEGGQFETTGMFEDFNGALKLKVTASKPSGAVKGAA